ncbi:MAG: hypothetical protein HC922_10250 [Leptolyngbyaceae cyanobacterium SM2_3_12]|nr:hypothetical protein [Leptolyngbyaceae cyanobacterium SM2_3_12]
MPAAPPDSPGDGAVCLGPKASRSSGSAAVGGGGDGAAIALQRLASHLKQTPDNLADYISEEIWDLLEVLQPGAVDGKGTATATLSPGPLVALPTLVSPLLWMLASSSYDTMHLIEGVRARVYDARAQFSLRLLRLVPVLRLTTDTTDYAWDLVTQNGAEPGNYLAPDTSLQLLDHDLDSQHLGLLGLLGQITAMAQRIQPGLSELLGQGCEVMALSPFHPWQPGHLTLRLHLADLGPPQSPSTPALVARPLAARSPSSPKPMAPSSSFTLEDFANTLGEDLEIIPLGVLGNWLTFTDEPWVQGFLSSCAQRLMTQPLGTAANDENPEVNPERVWAERVYQATELVQGPNGLFKHTFVHAPILVADLWPRLRWYLAQSSERIMQLMGGLAAQALRPGQSWQRGNLYLRP